jgi:hypothetical protein
MSPAPDPQPQRPNWDAHKQLHREGVGGSSPPEGFGFLPAQTAVSVSVQAFEGTRVVVANGSVWSGPRRRRFLMVIVRRLLRCCCGSASWSRRTSGSRLGWPSLSGG